ncbi:MAG: cation transporter [Betaproteobacteria bacterium]|nr:cation transporter [Betaproteobacteria bacterium]
MSDCGCTPTGAETVTQRRVLWIALWLNAAMFVVEVGAGTLVHSSGLIADGLDMLSDAIVFLIGLVATQRSNRFKANAASVSGAMLLLLGLGVVGDAGRRLIYGGSPEGTWMMATSLVALAVNATVLRLLAASRNDGVHMRAAWIFTRADVLANAAVILAGGAVLLTGARFFDLAIGGAIGLYVIREALEILGEAKAARIAG